MKICLINNLFTPDKKGGVETVVQTIADELIRQKHKVVIICAGREKNKTIEEKIDKFKIYRVGWDKYFAFQDIDNQNLLSRFFYHLHQLNNKYSTKIIRGILNKEKPDLILSHNVLGLGYNIIKEINLSLTFFKKGVGDKTSIKHINTIHDVQLIIPSGKLIVNQVINLAEKIYAFFTKNIYKNCKYIISPSQALLNFYTKREFFPNTQTKIISNPILLSKKNKAPLKKDSAKLKILYLGQLEKHKGLINLIKAFRTLNQDNFSLTIAGRGSLNEYLKNTECVLSNLKFFGEYNQLERIQLLQKHDLMVVPSLCFENAPMVILEAWEEGIPVLASNFGGISELIEEQKTGWLFNPENVDILKEKLKEIQKNRAELDQMSKHCLAKVKEFDVKNYIKKVLNYD